MGWNLPFGFFGPSPLVCEISDAWEGLQIYLPFDALGCTHCHTEKRDGGSERCREGCDDRVRDEVKRLSRRPETRVRAWPEVGLRRCMWNRE